MEEKTLFTSRPNLSSVPVLGDLGCEKQQVLMKHSLSWAAQEFATTLGFWIWNLFNLQQLGFADLGAVDGIGGVHFCLDPFVFDLACALLLCFFTCAQLASLIMNLIMLVIISLGKTSIKKNVFFRALPEWWGGVYPCPNFLALFQEVHFWSIKRVYFFKIANLLSF